MTEKLTCSKCGAYMKFNKVHICDNVMRKDLFSSRLKNALSGLHLVIRCLSYRSKEEKEIIKELNHLKKLVNDLISQKEK